eukprot:TRINITY_DN11262_c1_g2_i1.p1 TRINITY_DN11262_c1_g2~~TRINITY_DN11262_c1_g2_i1.p1  ORF type:complete len:326 (+),score=76.87 TRINITY_DN11262_c1_g2_i1:2-979(+)
MSTPMDIEGPGGISIRHVVCPKDDPSAEEDNDGDKTVQWARFLDPLQAKVGNAGITPLLAAAEADAPGVIAALLDVRADPGLGDDQGDTAVHYALLYGSPRALEELLSKGANPSAANQGGELPLHLVAEFGPGGDDDDLPPALARRHFARSLKAQEILVENLRVRGTLSAAVAAKAEGDAGNTPLHSVARWDHLGSQNAVRLLAAAKADLNAKNAEGRSALAISVKRFGASGKVAQLLRELGAEEALPGAEDSLAGAIGGCVRPLVQPTSINQGEVMTANSLEAALEEELGGQIRPLIGAAAPSDMEVDGNEAESASRPPLLPLQ